MLRTRDIMRAQCITSPGTSQHCFLGETFVAEAKLMFLKKFKNMFFRLDKYCVRGKTNRETFWETLTFTNVSATMFPRLP